MSFLRKYFILIFLPILLLSSFPAPASAGTYNELMETSTFRFSKVTADDTDVITATSLGPVSSGAIKDDSGNPIAFIISELKVGDEIGVINVWFDGSNPDSDDADLRFYFIDSSENLGLALGNIAFVNSQIGVIIVEDLENFGSSGEAVFITGEPDNDRTNITVGNSEEASQLIEGEQEEAVNATTATQEGEEPEESCSGLTIIGWVLCPIIELLYTGISSFFDLLKDNFLAAEPLSDQDAGEVTPQTVLYNAWNNFRVIANIVFVIVFLLAIFGNAFDFLLSAYEFKKIVPRLGIGFIGVQLSWYIAAFLIDFFNVLGAGVRAIMLAPVEGLQTIDLDFGSLGEFVGVIIGGGVAAIARFALGIKGVLGLLPFILLPILLIIIVTVLVLIFRQLLIFILIILSPLAFVAWILPGTDKYFKAWWDLFIKALVMYPLIVAFIASGELVAKILVAGNQDNGVFKLVGIVALFAPYFLIPQSFKFAGSIIGNVTSFVQQRGKQANQKLLGDIRDPFSYRGRRRAQGQKRRTQRTGDWVARNRGQIPTGLTGTQGLLNPKTYRGRGLRGAAGGLAAGAYTRLGGNIDETAAGRTADAMQWAQTTGAVDSSALLAQLGFKVNPFTGGQIQQKYINEAAQHQNDTARTTAALSVALSKAGDAQGVEALREQLVKQQSSGHMTENQAEQTWHAAAHHVQDLHDDLKHRDWKTGHLHSDEEGSKFLKKARNLQTSFAIDNQRDTYWNTLKEMHGRAANGVGGTGDVDDFNAIRQDTLRQLQQQFVFTNRDAIMKNLPAGSNINRINELFSQPQVMQQVLDGMASSGNYANAEQMIIERAPKGRQTIGAYNAMQDFLKNTSQI